MRPFIKEQMKEGWNMRLVFTANTRAEMLRRNLLTSPRVQKVLNLIRQDPSKGMFKHKVWDIAAAA